MSLLLLFGRQWSSIYTLYARDYVYLLPGSQVQIDTTAVYNRVYGVVQGGSTVAVATYDEPGDPLAYSQSPRECVVTLPQGTDSVAQALTEAVLEQRRQQRKVISGLKVRLADSLKLERGQRVRLMIDRAYVNEDLYVLDLEYDVASATCTVTLGAPGAKPLTDTDALVALAERIKALEQT